MRSRLARLQTRSDQESHHPTEHPQLFAAHDHLGRTKHLHCVIRAGIKMGRLYKRGSVPDVGPVRQVAAGGEFQQVEAVRVPRLRVWMWVVRTDRLE